MIDVQITVKDFELTFKPLTKVGLEFLKPRMKTATVHEIEGYNLIGAMEQAGIRYREKAAA